MRLPEVRIQPLLTRGFWNVERKQLETYTDLAVAVCPTGEIYVWLRSGGNRVVIGRYQAPETPCNYGRHRPRVDRAADVRKTCAALSPRCSTKLLRVQSAPKSGTATCKLTPGNWLLVIPSPNAF